MDDNMNKAGLASVGEGMTIGRLQPKDYSDLGVSDVFVRRYEGHLLFTPGLGWLYWHDGVWKADDHAAIQFAEWLMNEMLSDAETALKTYPDPWPLDKNKTDDQRTSLHIEKKARHRAARRYRDFVVTWRNRGHITAVVNLAIPPLKREADLFDADPFYLNTPAGTVDLHSGEMLHHSSLFFCTLMTAVSPGSEGAELWAKFLGEITCGDTELAEYLKNVAGMSLIGQVFTESLIIAYGPGSNGKSTFFNALAAVLGGYAGSVSADVLYGKRSINIGANLATLRGKRLAIFSELPEDVKLDTSILKRVASRDDLTIERKYYDPETIKPTHTPVLFTNHLPRVDSIDKGTWRRIAVVPFLADFSGARDKKDYCQTLIKNAGQAILQWAIDGAVQFVERGYTLPECRVVRESTSEYQNDNNWLKQFLLEAVIEAPELRCPSQHLYNRYRGWCNDTGQKRIRTQRELSAALKSAGYISYHGQSGTIWKGLAPGTSSAEEEALPLPFVRGG